MELQTPYNDDNNDDNGRDNNDDYDGDGDYDNDMMTTTIYGCGLSRNI